MRLFHYEVKAINADANQSLRLRSLLEWIEEASIADVLASHYSRDFFLKQDLLWVISRASFKIHRLPKYGEKLTLELYRGPLTHGLFPRYYQFYDASHTLVMEGGVLWALINKTTRHIIDPQTYKIRLIKNVPPTLSVINPWEIAIKEDTFAKTINEHIYPSDLDLNGHLTSARYGDFLTLFHPSTFYEEKPISAFSFIFYEEIKEGEDIAISSSLTNPEIIVIKEGAKRFFSAKITY